jgi:hypothetical protein
LEKSPKSSCFDKLNNRGLSSLKYRFFCASVLTTGDIWQFGKLEKNLFTKNQIPIYIQHVDELLGILDMLFSECEKV